MKPARSRRPHDGRDLRWIDHRAQRRIELLDDVILAVRTHGSSVGMEQIASTAGTSKAAFYRYFDDKGDLYRQVGRKLAGTMVADIWRAVGSESDDRTMLTAGVEAYLELLETEPELYRFVVHNPVFDSGTTSDYSSMLGDLIAGLFRARLAAVDAPEDAAEPWGVAVVGAVRAAGDWWLEHPEFSRRQLSDYLVALLWSGMSSAHTAFGSASSAGADAPAPSTTGHLS